MIFFTIVILAIVANFLWHRHQLMEQIKNQHTHCYHDIYSDNVYQLRRCCHCNREIERRPKFKGDHGGNVRPRHVLEEGAEWAAWEKREPIDYL